MKTMAPIPDEELVAYLDGALEPSRKADIDTALMHNEGLAARLAALDIDTGAIRTAFEALDTAKPVARLRQLLLARASRPRRVWTDLRWQSMAATLLLGAALGYGVPRVIPDHAKADWRVAVAEYQALYTTATLAPLDLDPSTQRAEVTSAGAALGRPITFAALQVAGLEFKRAQILDFDGRPLVQFAYLDAAGTPIAFCATRTGEPDSPVRTGELHTLAAAYWTKDGYAFIVIGGKRPEAVERAAAELSVRV
jgi:anti-sigma factor RsiW